MCGDAWPCLCAMLGKSEAALALAWRAALLYTEPAAEASSACVDILTAAPRADDREYSCRRYSQPSYPSLRRSNNCLFP